MLEQKRFVKKLLLSLLPLGVAAGVLLSCSNLSSGTEGGASNAAEHAKFTGTGARVYVSLPGQGRSAVARSAVPSAFEDANGDLIFAGAIYESSSTPPPLKAAEYTPASGGTPASIVVPFDISSSARASCVLELYAFASDYDSSAGFEENDALLSVQILNIAIAANEESLDLGTVAMQPHSATAQGIVSLAVTLPADCALSCSCATGNFDFSSGTITATNIASGAHTVNFTVTKGGQTAYAWTEIIYVYPGMVTNAWNTGEGGSTERVISAEQMYSTFYVRGSGSTWFDAFTCNQDADDANNNGSIAKPYATVQAAVDRILAINDGTTEYTIYVDGTVTGVTDISDTGTLKLSVIGLGTGSDIATLDGNSAGSVVTLNESNLNLTLNNIKFTGGNATSGGGIYVASGNVKLNECVVNGNTASKGGAIYIAAGTVEMTSGEIRGNTASITGGGIHNEGGTLTISGGSVSANQAMFGGGIVSAASGVLNISGNAVIGGETASDGNIANFNAMYGGGGGGIYTEGVVNISGGKIMYNKAEGGSGVVTLGGGIFLGKTSAAVTISGGIISNNSAVQGSGVYHFRGNLNLEKAAKIAGDVWLADGQFIKITDNLTATAPVAKISIPDANYVVGTQILNLSAISDANRAAVCNKFTLLNANGTENTDFVIQPDDTKGVLKAISGGSAGISIEEAIEILEDATYGQVISPLIVESLDNSQMEDFTDALWKSNGIVDLVINKVTGTTLFGDYAFTSTALRSIKIPEGITEIDYHAFKGSGNLETVVLPSTITKIDYGAFQNCYELTSINLPEGLEIIDYEVFDGCASLASITLPSTLKEIGDYAFDGCIFTSITIPASVTKIGEGVFGSCDTLDTVVFENTSGWKATNDDSYNGGSTINVSDTSQNASNFLSTELWYHKYLYRED